MRVENFSILYDHCSFSKEFDGNVSAAVLREGALSLSPPPLSCLAALHWSVVLFLNELRLHWRDRPLPICANLLHVLEGFY